jgi:hypothetical protein
VSFKTKIVAILFVSIYSLLSFVCFINLRQ